MVKGDLVDTDNMFLLYPALKFKMANCAHKHGMEHVSPDVLETLSAGLQLQMTSFLKRVVNLSHHRIDVDKTALDFDYEVTGDNRRQRLIFERMDKQARERKRAEDEEMLQKASKSRSKFSQADPSMMMLKEKAKQQREEKDATQRHMAANTTALLQIGGMFNKKKKKRAPTLINHQPATPGPAPDTPGNALGRIESVVVDPGTPASPGLYGTPGLDADGNMDEDNDHTDFTAAHHRYQTLQAKSVKGALTKVEVREMKELQGKINIGGGAGGERTLIHRRSGMIHQKRKMTMTDLIHCVNQDRLLNKSLWASKLKLSHGLK
ncbi:hypothetical protein SARC_06874 [Sphaeroforma arctica JP610]|uniref:Transcription initiation factor TFIID component TAF4 C-terminal domain-containing protein n=1 Tax=Sphaeroforma arctica JP610 TaxID=667725 RepID=A0A0L0FVA2_9EUKA|nr:hypothetical protein SARC_06874 [Sphaeroforma arctica JP610]KNC80780.1 hypothetical protein SARC_06874 [Sphaeroforma arctica JP610]|eukprot:XP_014154682.1 hypothetical protein SARC_06874 [Sphaeroforma arctica JP610]